MSRMRILTTQEQDLLDHPPVFNYAQRKQFFNLPKTLMDTAKTLRSPSSQVGFLLMCGYFKASKRFFLPQDFHPRDIEAVANQLDFYAADFKPGGYRETTRLRHQKIILNFYGFQLFDKSAEQLGVVSRNPRKFRHPNSSPATSTSRSIILPPLWNV